MCRLYAPRAPAAGRERAVESGATTLQDGEPDAAAMWRITEWLEAVE
jgi:hypothetical protein